MRSIYKYEIKSDQALATPEGSNFLKVGVQNDRIYAWYDVNLNTRIYSTEKYIIFPTGWKIQTGDLEKLTYIDTVFIGSLVWHIYKE